MNWLLPEYVADVLPNEAVRLEAERRAVLDLFAVHGYEFVIPPLIEFLDSLLTGSGSDLNLQTFKLTDQLSGRTIGIRADMTPQVSRIDAHLLNREGVVRLCYCDRTLHTLPPTYAANREPLQIGAELYGYEDLEADIEIIRLLAKALETLSLPADRIDISHVGIFRALVKKAYLSAQEENELLLLLQNKDGPELERFSAFLSSELRMILMQLPMLYGGAETIERAARILPDDDEDISSALNDLRRLATELTDLPISFDFADLRGYHYHNGVVFAAYNGKAPGAIALGGRYDGVGRVFGRERAATGFSFDLREIVRLSAKNHACSMILAPYSKDDAELKAEIARLRSEGEIVVEMLPGEDRTIGAKYERKLSKQAGCWQVSASSNPVKEE